MSRRKNSWFFYTLPVQAELESYKLIMPFNPIWSRKSSAWSNVDAIHCPLVPFNGWKLIGTSFICKQFRGWVPSKSSQWYLCTAAHLDVIVKLISLSNSTIINQTSWHYHVTLNPENNLFISDIVPVITTSKHWNTASNGRFFRIWLRKWELIGNQIDCLRFWKRNNAKVDAGGIHVPNIYASLK